MSTSIFLARLIGPVLLVIGVAILSDRDGFREMARQLLASRPLIFFAGLAPLVAGLSIVLNHNIWAADWRILITLFGWLAMCVGAFRILRPARVAATGSKMIEKPATLTTVAAVMLVLGALFCFFGYIR